MTTTPIFHDDSALRAEVEYHHRSSIRWALTTVIASVAVVCCLLSLNHTKARTVKAETEAAILRAMVVDVPQITSSALGATVAEGGTACMERGDLMVCMRARGE